VITPHFGTGDLRVSMIFVEGSVDDRGSDLEHQMRASRRPTHLLIGTHPAVQQPLHRALVVAVEIGSS
jgi:hypothetical protein